MLGFAPLAALPGASAGTDISRALGSQSATLLLNSVAIGSFIYEAPSFSLTATLEDIALSTAALYTAPSQSLGLIQNDAAAGVNVAPTIDSQAVTATLESVVLSTQNNIQITGQSLQSLVNFVQVQTGQTLSVTGQSLYTTLHKLRLWQTVGTVQPTNCSGQPPAWSDIAFGDLLIGDNFAIAATPIAGTPQPLPPIRKTPPQAWDQINTATTSAWDTIET